MSEGALTVVSDDPVSGEPVDAAIFASSTNSLGVLAESVNLHGVLAISTNAPGIGVLSRTRHAVIANGTVKAGVLGYVPHGPFPFTPDGTGVHGHGPVLGVLGTSADGIAVSAQSANGVALDVQGAALFSTAGLATIAKGDASVVVTPGVAITEDSKVLATLQSDPGGNTAVHRVERDPVTDTVTVHLNSPAAKECEVAWFVIS